MPTGEAPTRPPLARGPVLAAAGTLAVVLTTLSGLYGYHRDELYFRMLPPAWGYVDQPFLAPFLARTLSAVVDEPWAMRVPSTLAAAVTVVLVAQVTRELGGGRRAQGLAAWGAGFGAYPLVFGHLLLTSGLDLLAWVALLLCLVRALLRRTPYGDRWWLGVGAAAGIATWDKLLVGLLLVCLAVALAAVGPRSLPWRWVAGATLLALALAAPTVVFQATHGWPQVAMGRALGANHGSETRVLMWPLLLVLLGPLLVPLWGRGLVALWRRPAWRSLRALPVAFATLLLLTAVGGGQPYYPLGLLVVLYAAGCATVAPTARRWWHGWGAAVLANALVAAVIALPIVPQSVLGATPVPAVNAAAGDQVGWPTVVRQVGAVWQGLDPADRAGAIVVTGNYGEAGAVARYGAPYGLPRPVSGHNALGDVVPPETRAVAVVVGSGAVRAAGRVATCTVLARLDDGQDLAVAVDNEEQGQPVAVCLDPRTSWRQAWPGFRHLD